MAEPIVPPTGPKPGIKTSEFWLTVVLDVLGLVGQYAGAIPEPWGSIMAAVTSLGYVISRSLVKRGT